MTPATAATQLLLTEVVIMLDLSYNSFVVSAVLSLLLQLILSLLLIFCFLMLFVLIQTVVVDFFRVVLLFVLRLVALKILDQLVLR